MILKRLHRAVAPVFIGTMLGCTASSNQQPIVGAGVRTDGIHFLRRWANVSIGSRGFVTGVYTHNTQKDLV
jgi:hypothetical protein